MRQHLHVAALRGVVEADHALEVVALVGVDPAVVAALVVVRVHHRHAAVAAEQVGVGQGLVDRVHDRVAEAGVVGDVVGDGESHRARTGQRLAVGARIHQQVHAAAVGEGVAHRVEQREVVGRVRGGLQVRRQELVVVGIAAAAAGDHLAEHHHPGAHLRIEHLVQMVEGHVLGRIDAETGDAQRLQRQQVVALLLHHPVVADQIRQAGIVAAAADAVGAYLVRVVVVGDALRRAEIAGAEEILREVAEQSQRRIALRIGGVLAEHRAARVVQVRARGRFVGHVVEHHVGIGFHAHRLQRLHHAGEGVGVAERVVDQTHVLRLVARPPGVALRAVGRRHQHLAVAGGGDLRGTRFHGGVGPVEGMQDDVGLGAGGGQEQQQADQQAAPAVQAQQTICSGWDAHRSISSVRGRRQDACRTGA
ncbi:hypothetical protein NB689_001738 [Xanthomonas sacchari]|nr:hypothetical protein [Xanthomonas sacchari]